MFSSGGQGDEVHEIMGPCIGDASKFQRGFPIASMVFLAGDIGFQICH